MGVVASVILTPLRLIGEGLLALSSLVTRLLGGDWDENPTMAAIEEQLQKQTQDVDFANKRAAAAEGEAERLKGDMKKVQEGVDEEKRKAAAQAVADIKAGVTPVDLPTPEQFAAFKQRYQYNKSKFHLAVAGVSGTGKSTLINAMRGLRNKAKDAARTDIIECTPKVTRYPDGSRPKIVWFDVPGASTLSVPDWQYFNDQGLYVFEAIIVLYSDRFTATDGAILRNCARYNIPAYLVRSQSDIALRKIIAEMIDEEDFRLADVDPTILDEARKELITKTERNVAENLERADLTWLSDVWKKEERQLVYLVSRDTVYSTVNGTVKGNTIFLHERELLNDLLGTALKRRGDIVS